jgi:3D (Asp-Asp-Asp) domain-containing protein
MIRSQLFLCLFVIALFSECNNDSIKEHSLEVVATAYNSLPDQTHKDHPTTAAWGDELEPGMKCIAVSRDLIAKGLGHNTEVTIKGLSGTYTVLDKMNERYSNAIDIYMGVDEEAAHTWGKKKVTITWKVKLQEK